MILPPINPCFSLENYILKLREDIKIIGISKLLQKWHKSKFTAYYSAAKKFEISERFYRNVITGKIAVPILVLKRLCNFDINLISQIYDGNILFTARVQRDKLPTKMTPQLSYYTGYLHGDGHIDRDSKRITFTDKNREQLQVIEELTKLIFNVNGRIYFRRNKFGEGANAFDVGRVTINSFFSDIIGINKGKRKHNNIPRVIKQNKIILKWYICGLFDAEGAMPLNPRRKRNLYIDIAMTDIQLIKEVGELLEKHFNIKACGPYKRLTQHKSGYTSISSELRIRKYSEIVKFLNTIGTLHPDKIRRKEMILNILHP